MQWLLKRIMQYTNAAIAITEQFGLFFKMQSKTANYSQNDNQDYFDQY